MNRISVVVPAYNAETTIEKCLESIINQTEQVYEIIVVNDGSKDKTEEKVKKLQEKCKLIKYYYKENKGVADTRNFGINKATGEYILFVDSDDYIELELVKKVNKYVEQGIELIKFKLKRVDNNGKELEKVEGPAFDKIIGEEAFNILYYQDLLIDSPCVYVIKKDIFIRNNLKFKGKYHEDFGIIPLVLATAKTVVSLKDFFYIYVQGQNSITRNDDYNKTIEKMQCVLFQYDNMIKIIEKLELKEQTKQNIKIYYTNAILVKLQELKNKERNQFIKEIKKRKMYKNIKPVNLKQSIKRFVLKISVNLYLKLR